MEDQYRTARNHALYLLSCTQPMIITQPDRVILEEQIRRFAPSLKGRLLDVGAGKVLRYKNLCTNITEYQTLERDASYGADIVGNAEAIPVPDASYDSVLCTQVLEHLPHPQKAVAEMFRILRPGGYCLLTAPQTNELHDEPYDFFRYTNHGFRVVFEDAGFIVENIDQRGKYHCTTMQIRIRHMVNTLKPYQNKGAMLLLAPLTAVLTKYARWRDNISKSPAVSMHAIGWCVLAQKPE